MPPPVALRLSGPWRFNPALQLQQESSTAYTARSSCEVFLPAATVRPVLILLDGDVLSTDEFDAGPALSVETVRWSLDMFAAVIPVFGSTRAHTDARG